MKKIFTLLFSALSIGSFAASTTVVISQVYGGGGGASGTYKPDYVELHNISTTAQDISGFQLMYGASGGQFGSSASNIFTFPASTSIPAGKYLLIQLGTVGTGGADLPVTPDFTTTNLNMSGTSGKVALVTAAFTGNTCGATATPCSIPNSNIIDLVSYGAANNAEGGTSVNNGVALTATQGAIRKTLGCQDTDNNNADFDVVTNPVPRNSASGAVVCAALPLSLVSFDAVANNKIIGLSWATSNETNTSSIELERSANGKEFSRIGSVTAKNGLSNSYAYTDEKAVAGTNYYRLKMIDKDGSYKYSQIVTVKTRSVGLGVYPNPVKAELTIQHEAITKGATISVVNFEGKQVMNVNVQIGATQTTVDAAKLAPGSYMIIFNNNGERSTKQFVKQ